MKTLQGLRDALQQATRVTVLTGAGISAESGVPTFRGAGGLWRNYSPEELATPQAIARDPRLVWEWYDWRRGNLHRVRPQAGIFLVNGTSAVVYPAAGLAREAEARRAVVNPEPMPLDDQADWALQGESGKLLPRLI